MDCDEHIILKKLRDGDSEALDILYLRYASKVRDFAFRLLKDRTDAEDVTHDIFLKSAGDSGPSFRFGAICSA